MISDLKEYQQENVYIDEDMIRELTNRPTGHGVIGPYWSIFNIGKSFDAFKNAKLKGEKHKIGSFVVTDFKDFFKKPGDNQ